MVCEGRLKMSFRRPLVWLERGVYKGCTRIPSLRDLLVCECAALPHSAACTLKPCPIQFFQQRRPTRFFAISFPDFVGEVFHRLPLCGILAAEDL